MHVWEYLNFSSAQSMTMTANGTAHWYTNSTKVYKIENLGTQPAFGNIAALVTLPLSTDLLWVMRHMDTRTLLSLS